jgi:hypothetical protein
MSLPVILNQRHYVDDLIKQITHPDTTEVWIQAMVFSPRGEVLKKLIDALHELIARGGKATIITDYYNHLRPEDYEPNKHIHEPFYLQEVKNIYDSFRESKEAFLKAGGSWIETNRDMFVTKLVDVWNRNHMKSAGIIKKNGEQFTYIGGCNLYPQAMEFIDFMVRFDDEVILQKMKIVIDMVINRIPLSDARISCTDEYTLYIDGGRIPGISIIMKTALQMVKAPDVSTIYLTSQLPLDPVLEGSLKKAAARGTKVHIFIPNPGKTNVLNEGVGKWLYERMVKTEKRLEHYYLYRSMERKVHAKLLVTEYKDGTIQTLWGSNNYFLLGPLLCTPEIQMHSKNQELNHLLRDFFWNMVEGAAEAAPVASTPASS